MSYLAWKNAAIAFLGFYCIAGVIAIDKYPFFNWSLFSQIPNEQSGYTIEIYSFEGKTYDPPLPFSQTKPFFETIKQSPTEYTPRIEQLGLAIDEVNQEKIRNWRQGLEEMFDGKSFRYGVLKVVFDPVEYWKTGGYRSSERIAVYDSAKKP